MKDARAHRAKRNMITTLANQLVQTVCGIIAPRLIIGAFGSELYGATTSIAQFLSYIFLLDSGIGSVARAALYKPLADQDMYEVSKVYHAVKRFLRVIGIAFIFYSITLAVVYYDIANISQISREYTFLLVLTISLSTMVDYFFGITNMTLLDADQKKHITNWAVIVTRIANTLLLVILINLGSDLLVVKFVSKLVIIARPIFYALYVKKHYTLQRVEKKDAVLKHKWTGLGQHFAYFVHANTDIVLLTLFANLQTVSVYSIYSLVATSIKSIASSFAGGMEAELGDIIAKNETNLLRATYRRYQHLLSTVSMILFGTAAIMVVPFVILYTKGITDANYVQPAFGLILIMAEATHCMSLPWSSLPISANRLKQTQWGAFGEAIINIVVSCILIQWNPLLGVALGTLSAEIFKSLFYMIYAAKHILGVAVWKEVTRFAGSFLILMAICLGGTWLVQEVNIANYLIWAGYSTITVLCVAAVIITVNLAFYPKESRQLIAGISSKFLHRRASK